MPSSPAPDGLRLLSWNVAQRTAGWDHVVELCREHGVDVAMLQEARRPPADLNGLATWPAPEDKAAWHTWDRPDSVGRRWCAALAWFDWTRFEVDPEARVRLVDAKWDEPTISHPGQFAVGHLRTGPTDSLTLVSLYGIWDSQPEKRTQIFAEATLHRAVSDLTPLLRSGRPVVIAGDLNLVRDYEGAQAWQAQSDTVFDRLEAYGVEVVGPHRPSDVTLTNCPCRRPHTCRHVNTRPTPSGVPTQIDWVLSNLDPTRFEMHALPVDASASDHAPILIDVEPEVP
jgi:endonuclease/exonuclease/phosphatase family metal-dependent hydrolase